MAAPRKYSDAQRAAMFALYRQGMIAAQIARKCEAGLVSIAPFSIPGEPSKGVVAMAQKSLTTPRRIWTANCRSRYA